MSTINALVWVLTSVFLVLVSLSSLPESHHGPEVCAEHCPAESCRRIDADKPADEGVLAAL